MGAVTIPPPTPLGGGWAFETILYGGGPAGYRLVRALVSPNRRHVWIPAPRPTPAERLAGVVTSN